MFGFTLRTNFNDLRPALRDTPKPAYQPAPESEGLQYTTVANQLTALKYNAGFDAPEIQLRDKTLYMSGQQYKYRDSREAVDRANRILVNNLPQGVEKISVTQKREHMAMATTETDVASANSWQVQRLVNQSHCNNNVLKLKIFLPLVEATVFVKIALATLSTQHFHSRWAARKISICSSWG